MHAQITTFKKKLVQREFMNKIRAVIAQIKRIIFGPRKIKFTTYKKYWEERYAVGGTSGSGSYGLLAEFKIEVINKYIKDHKISSIIDFGCGDGNQLKGMNYKKYLGLDVSKTAIELCSKKFKNDKTKQFLVYDPKTFDIKTLPKPDLVVSLDVLYHIIDEEALRKTLQDMFSCSAKYIILYTTVYELDQKVGPHIKYRDIMPYLDKFSDYEIDKIVPQKYKHLSLADFIILKKKNR